MAGLVRAQKWIHNDTFNNRLPKSPCLSEEQSQIRDASFRFLKNNIHLRVFKKEGEKASYKAALRR